MRPFAPDVPWRFEPGLTFLNHGVFGATPVPVTEAQAGLHRELEANPIRFLGREYEARLDAAREAVAGFLDADPAGLVFVPNATTGVNAVLRSLRLRPGDELLTTDHEYNATLNALAAVAEPARARVVRVGIALPIRHPEEVVEAILAAVTSRTRLALVSHVTSPTALVLPIETIVRELDRIGVDTLVDAAHAPGMVPIDLRALGAAYWAGNGHKWLCGPKGSAVLHVREDRRSEVLPLVTSHGRNDPRPRPRLWREFDWQGTIDPTPYLALPEALRVVGGLLPGGWPAVMAANRALALQARERVLATVGGEPIAPASMVGAMVAVRLPWLASDAEAEALARALAEEDRIEVAVAPWPVPAAREQPESAPTANLLRVSAQVYNDAADVDALVAALPRRADVVASGTGAG